MLYVNYISVLKKVLSLHHISLRICFQFLRYSSKSLEMGPIKKASPCFPIFHPPGDFGSEHLVVIAPQVKGLCLVVFLLPIPLDHFKTSCLKYWFVSSYKDLLPNYHSRKFLKWTQINKVSIIVKFLSTVCKQHRCIFRLPSCKGVIFGKCLADKKTVGDGIEKIFPFF